ncbi:hypothetical protein BB560_006766 [Smittium megazygosporum]|uniref:Uncharacterized protein n=1 Tax=Smittium megazygosporum TaxID=133381 RepID=A0A2T9Y1W1_9FUNG|nr:hypothetical protein BB560_006766 [Smittium megazygosporum]
MFNNLDVPSFPNIQKRGSRNILKKSPSKNIINSLGSEKQIFVRQKIKTKEETVSILSLSVDSMLRKSRDNREMVYRYIQEYKRENFKSKISNFPEHNVNGMLCIDLPTEMELKNINGKTIFDRFIVDTQELSKKLRQPKTSWNSLKFLLKKNYIKIKKSLNKDILQNAKIDRFCIEENSPLYKFEDPCDKKVLGADFGSIKQGSLKVKKLASELSYINLKSPDKTQNEFEKAQIYTEKQYNDSGNIEPWYTFSENDSKESSLTEFVGQNVNKFHFKPSKSKSVDDLCLINGRIKRINTTKSMNILKADTRKSL